MDLRAGTLLESEALQNEETGDRWSKIVLQPTWLSVRIWEIVVALAAMLSSTVVVYQATVDGTSPFGVLLIYISDVIYVFGIISRLFTGYQKNGVTVTDFREITLRNLKSTLIVDLISTIPFELPAFFFSGYVTSLLRLNRTLRYYRPWNLCSENLKYAWLKIYAVKYNNFIVF